MSDLKGYSTPGTPGIGVHKKNEGETGISSDLQTLVQSGVGMLLWLVKHKRPDVSNPVRELSKATSEATGFAWKELRRVIRYVLDTRNLGLKMEVKSTKDDWDLLVYTDSDYAGDKETRKSVTGYVIYLRGVPICWKSKAQRSVTLSSTEAEFVALSEAAKEIKFIVQVMWSLNMSVELPVVVRVDNVGAIYLANNLNTSQRTKHIDVRYNYVREFVEDDFIKIYFVRTDENDADIFTKNTTTDIFQRHSEKLVGEK